MAITVLTITKSKTLLRALGIAFGGDPAEFWKRYNGPCLDDLPIALALPDLVVLDVGSLRGNLDGRSRNHISALASRSALILLHGEEDENILAQLLEHADCPTLKKPFSSEEFEQSMRTLLGDRYPQSSDANSNVSSELLSGQRARPAFDLADSGEPIEGPKFAGESEDNTNSIDAAATEDAFSEFARLTELAEQRSQGMKASNMDVDKPSGDLYNTLTDQVVTEIKTDSVEVQGHLRKMVEEYCQKNFSRVARQVLEEELQKVQKEHDRIRYGNSGA